jgi:hypothetical protein
LAAPLGPELSGVLSEVCQQAGLRREPHAVCVGGAISPLVIAWFRRPVLILPQEIFARLNPTQPRLVIAHEVAHLRRRDHWVRYPEAAAGIVYWWHPLVWIARSELRIAEEECCDQLVLQWYPDDAQAYGAAIGPVWRRSLARRRASSPFFRCAGRLGSTRRQSHAGICHAAYDLRHIELKLRSPMPIEARGAPAPVVAVMRKM